MTAETSPRKALHEAFAEEIIAGLKNGTAAWVRPWKAGELELPFNAASERTYKGPANIFRLVNQGYADPRWMTLKQANGENMRIRKGSRSTRIVYWQFTKKEPVRDDAGRPTVDETGNAITRTVPLDRPLMITANVFHASQIEGLPEWKPQTPSWNPDERAEAILAKSGAIIRQDQRDRAFYSPKTDEIHLPLKASFSDMSAYYETALHELGHWMCSENRLNLGFKGPFGSESYAREELRVEIASWMTCMELGLPYEADQHLSYVDSWIKALESDPYEIVRACRDAEHIKDRLLDLEQNRTLEAPAMQSDIAEKRSAVEPDIPSEAARTVPEPTIAKKTVEKTWLNVPYLEKKKAKGVGAQWDRIEKRWYVPAGSDLSAFAVWLPEKGERAIPSKVQSSSPEIEFAERLRDAGLVLEGAPVMDGAMHRVPVAGKLRGRDGAYVGHADGIPSGWFQNHVTGETGNWKHSGHHLDQAQLEQLRIESAKQREVAAQERQAQQEKAAKRCYAIWKNAPGWARDGQEYLARKQVRSFGVKVDDKGNLLIPGRDVNGFIHTLQTVTPDGKLFETGSRKTGAFHVIDPEKSFGTGTILIAEGYATAASVHLATGQPCVCAFDAGNLIHVAKALREKYPDASLVFMADDDQRNPANPGINKAKLAADAVAGMVLAPVFTPDEIEHGLTDWNDLHSAQGLEAVKKQIDFARPLYQALVQKEELQLGKPEKAKGKELGLAI